MQQNDLTQGRILPSLLRFAIPFLLANFVQALYGAVDTAVVGWFSNDAGISAVSIGSQVMQIIQAFMVGLTTGGTVLIAQYCGGQKRQDVSQTISTMLLTFTVFSLILTGVMFLSCDGILFLLQTPKEAMQMAREYVMVCSAGILFLVMYNAVSAVLRGTGDSRHPLIFIAIACVTNMILDVLMVGGLGMGPAGAALATICSQALSMVVSLLFLKRQTQLIDLHWKRLRLSVEKLKLVFQIGFPISLQDTMVHISFLIIAAIINHMGLIASAAVGIANKFEGFAMLPAAAFSGAIATFAAQNMGAGKPERAQKGLHWSIISALLPAVLFFLWSQLLPETIFAIFNASPEVTEAGVSYLRSFSIDFLLVAFVFSMNGFCNGCGKTTFTMINGIAATILIRIPVSYIVMTLNGGLFEVGLAAPLASFLSIVVAFFYIRTGKWKNFKLSEKTQ
ncbi:Staphylococcal virulence regulator protein A [uncultured Ruminococcus sp.]|nr:Staphylococcal virulence regulator protein A [uncultured Clostridium sp.]SCH95422.1 Staphylococcal virulence regulator protein A [uncultured Ruminococcus sp.]